MCACVFWGLPCTARGVLCSPSSRTERGHVTYLRNSPWTSPLHKHSPVEHIPLSHSLSLSHTHTHIHTHLPLDRHGDSQAFTRWYITQTVSIMQILRGPETPPGTYTNCLHCWHTSPSSCFQCCGLTKQVVLIKARLEKKKWAETKSNTCMSRSCHDVFVCFLLVECFVCFFLSFFNSTFRVMRETSDLQKIPKLPLQPWHISPCLGIHWNSPTLVCGGKKTICLSLASADLYRTKV